MPRVLITAEVDDLESGRRASELTVTCFGQMGVSSMEFGTSEGNRVAVCGETSNLDAYMKIFNSPATAAAMALMGSSGDGEDVRVGQRGQSLAVLPHRSRAGPAGEASS